VPCSITKSILLRATRPPKVRETWVAERRFGIGSFLDPPRSNRGGRGGWKFVVGVQVGPIRIGNVRHCSPTRREDAGWAKEHEQHQREAENELASVGQVDGEENGSVQGSSKAVNPGGDAVGQ